MKDINKLIEQGFELHKKGNVKKALEFYLKALPKSNKNSNLFFLIGTANFQINNFEKSINYFKEAIKIDPKNIGAYNNLGGALQNLKRYEEAINIFNELIIINPKFAEAYNNIGNCYFFLNENEKAIKNYQKTIELDSKNFTAYSNIGNVFSELNLFEKAITNYKKSISLNSKYFIAFNNLGNVYKDINNYEAAIKSYKKAIEINNNYTTAYKSLGDTFHIIRKFNEASSYYKKAYEISQDNQFVLGKLIHNKMYICEWKEIQNYQKTLVFKLKDKKKVTVPFELLSIVDNPEDQLLASKIYLEDKPIKNTNERPKIKKNRSGKIKIGYFSPDFRNHPVLHLIKDVFKHHDKSKFEVYAFSFEKDKNDEFTNEIKGYFKNFIEVKEMSDEEIFKFTKEIDLDIAVDLCGHTAFNRIKLFSYRIAPIQINYLGYPGTTGAKFMDYIIGDKIVIPEKEKENYSEKVFYLPNCYQPNSEYKKLENKNLKKEDFNLPTDKLIFCNFGSNFKITPEIFDIWMNILREVPNSILWLFKSNEQVVKNLRYESQERNIEKERIIFAEKVPHKEHLRRFCLADIFLDTFPYSSHTTASDAIRMGVPIISFIGRSFASRVCASILEQVNLGKLVAKTNEEFEKKAIYYGNNRNELLKLKNELKNNCENSSLFKIQDFTRHLEAVYLNLVEKI